MSQTAQAYLTRALDAMERHSMHRQQIDWSALRRRAFEKAANAQDTRDTYEAIRWAVKELNDGHSFFSTPTAKSALNSKENKTASASDPSPREVPSRSQTQTPAPAKTKTKTIEGAGWVIASTAGDLRGELITSASDGKETKIGYILVPSFGGQESFDPTKAAAFANTLHDQIRQLEKLGASDWIVDLRFNSGGNMWPMLAGIGPLLGADRVGAFNADGQAPVAWEYKEGRAGTPGSVSVSVANAYTLKNANARVAVLIGKYCTSSGEAIAVAFRGRDRSRFFGKPSGGATTSTQTVWMGDGAMLFVTNAIFADRRGTLYGGKLTPDEFVAGSPDELADPPPQLLDDPAVTAALSWLRSR
jgi:C-terminal processing protease CtpA/Prc